MKNIDYLTDEELERLLDKPISDNLSERLRKADESAAWLLNLNLREMDREAMEEIENEKH